MDPNEFFKGPRGRLYAYLMAAILILTAIVGAAYILKLRSQTFIPPQKPAVAPTGQITTPTQ